jgi:hypothetical protein
MGREAVPATLDPSAGLLRRGRAEPLAARPVQAAAACRRFQPLGTRPLLPAAAVGLPASLLLQVAAQIRGFEP